METLVGTVHRIIWTSPEKDNNFKIFVLKNKNGQYSTVSGDFQEIVEGVSIEVHGDFKDHPKYGKGFRAKAHTFTYDKSSSISIALYLQSIAKFIGPVRSHDIAFHFGEELEDVIENHPERLCEIDNIGVKIAQSIVKAWNEHREEKSVRIFLHSLGLSENNIKKILLRFGIDAETKIKENPYLLCFSGFGFTTCDFIAGRLHFSADDPLRYSHFILWVLKEALNSGHLFLYDHQIIKAINTYNQGTSFKFKSTEIITQDIEVHLIHLENEGYIVRNGNRYYELNLFFYENESARILSLIAKKPDKCNLGHIDAEKFIEEYETSQQDPTRPGLFKLSEEQKDAIRSFIKEKILIITGSPGTGKCLGYNTPVMMFDGSIKMVQDIKENDFLMGDDSAYRRVLSITKGKDYLYKINPAKGDPYVVNESHILSLKESGYSNRKKGTIYDLSVLEYLSLNKSKKHHLKGYRVPLSFKEKEVPIEPYLIGYWLGNGASANTGISTIFSEVLHKISSIIEKYGISLKKDKGDNVDYNISCDRDSETYSNLSDKRQPNYFLTVLKDLNLIENKHIPLIYKINSEKIRFEILAGILDSDGHLDRCNVFDVIFKSKRLAEDTVFLARSLGLSAYIKPCIKKWTSPRKNNKYIGQDNYFRFCVSGKNIEKIPTVVTKKKAIERKQKKDNLVTGIKVEPIGYGDYYGFEIDGNGRFLLGDFTVTHNTTIIKSFVELMIQNKINFDLLTPTGIASKKLGVTVGYEAYTIHRKLGYKGSTWDYNINNKYDTEVIVVDELSMVDQEVFYRLISAIYTHTKLVFVGDNDQLPSVGPGRVLNELIKSNVIKTISLKNIFRQEEQSDIIKEAKKIRDGDIDLSLFKNNPKADIWFIRNQNITELEKTIIKFAKDLKNKIKENGLKKTFQIITPRNSGPLSVDTLNTALQQSLNPKIEGDREINVNGGIIRKGDRVLIRKNDYELGVFNGDIGKVKNFLATNIIVEINDYDGKKEVNIPIEAADELLKLAYVITVHKCLKKDALIYTPNGPFKMDFINENDLVQTKSGPFKVIKKSNTGKNRIIKIRTRTGTIYESSEDHQYLIANSTGIIYKKASNITKNDFLCIYRDGLDGKYQEINFKDISYEYNSIALNLPGKLDEDLCWLLGVLVGDSCYTDEDDGTIELTGPTKIEILEKAKRIFQSIGLNVGTHKKSGKIYSYYVISKNFRTWLLSFGIDYSIARDKTIPDIIFRSPKSCRASFIGGLFDTDGCADKHPQVRMTTASEKLATDLKNLLLTIGIVSFHTKQSQLHHKVTISGLDLIKFIEQIPIVHPRKNFRLKNYNITTKSNHYEIPFGKNFIIPFLQVFKEKEGNSRGILGKGLFSKYKSFSTSINNIKRNINKFRQHMLNKMMEISIKEGFSIPEEIKETISNNWYYDKIDNITIDEEDITYEIEVEQEHSYIYNGAICHNSQGMEYDLVLLPFIKFHGKRILQRNLLYTAITRARKKVMVFGQGSAIVDAIENDKIQERNTLFSQRIAEWMKNEGTSLRQLYNNPSNYQNAETLKQLLLLEEKASVESVTTNESLQKRLEKSEDQTYFSHPRFLTPSNPISLEKALMTMEEKFKDLENQESREILPF